jgi:hypothetical protein
MSGRTAGGRTRAWRAGQARAPRIGRSVAATLALAAIGVPAALLASQIPAAAAAGKRLAHGQVSVVITSMTPQQAAPGAIITLAGTVTNSTRQRIGNLSVQLLASKTPVSPSAQLLPGGTAQDDPAITQVPKGVWKSGAALPPGSTDHWSVQVKANSIGMTTFGVYPLTAQAQTAQLPLASATTYLPYVPARKGPYGRSIPARTKIAWVLPLIDKPLLGQPWQDSCAGPQAEALVASLGSNGRLGQLVAAGGDSAGTADAYAAAAASRGTAQNRDVGSEQVQSLSSYDGVTWAVDPALLANVSALADCGTSQPRWASAARYWLAELQRVTAAEPMFVTPYADPDVSALANDRFTNDVGMAFNLGRDIGQQILHRNFGSLTTTGRSPGAQSQAAGIAWPADGISGYPTAENLEVNRVSTLLLSSSALPAEQSTVVRALNSVGGYMNILLANEKLTRLLASGGSTAGSAFATSQDFLAQTALAAQQNQGAPVIVAPPQRFDPAAGVTTDLLAETASATWLTPVSLSSLAAGNHIPRVSWSAFISSAARISNHEQRKLELVDSGIGQLEQMAANRETSLSLAAATIESSAWQGKSSRTTWALLRTVIGKINQQERGVQIVAESRVTLGGLKGNVPVSIDNRLGYAVNVRLKLQSQATGVSFTPLPPGVVTVQAHTAVTVRVHVQATEVGSSNVTMSLLDQDGLPLPAQGESMTVEATQVGVLGVIICAAALGVFLIAYAVRAARRAHPAGGAGAPAGTDPVADQGRDHSAEPAEPDTVMAERTELGSAGAPGP